jgi:hypothetical protein
MPGDRAARLTGRATDEAAVTYSNEETLMTQYLRIVGSIAQTPVRDYVRHKDDSVATVVALSHIGAARYYDEVRAMVADWQAGGSVVLCEGSGQLVTDEHIAGANALELAVLRGRELALSLEQERMPLLGWQSQSAALGWPDTWRVVDVNTVELARRIGAAKALRMTLAEIMSFGWAVDNEGAFKRCRLQVAWSMAHMAKRSRRGRRRGRVSQWNQALLVDREKLVLETVAETGPDVVLVLGAAHVPGLDEGLTAQGYELSNETWLSVGYVPSRWEAFLGLFGKVSVEPFDDVMVSPSDTGQAGVGRRRELQGQRP